MAIKKVDNCVGCGKVNVLICDMCGEEFEDLYWYGEKDQFCEDCWKEASFTNDAPIVIWRRLE